MAEERLSEVKLSQQKTPKLRSKIRLKTSQENRQELWDNYRRCNITHSENPEAKERKGQEKYLKQEQQRMSHNVRHQTNRSRNIGEE